VDAQPDPNEDKDKKQEEEPEKPEVRGPAVTLALPTNQGPLTIISLSPPTSAIRLKPLKIVKPVHLGQDAVNRMEKELFELLRDLTPMSDTFDVREKVRARVEEVVRKEFTEAKVSLYGSSVSQLCEARSDLDLTMEFKYEGELPKLIEQLGALFEKEFKEVTALPNARVPIVKFLIPSFGLRCDLGVNNMLACRNSRLLRDYGVIDPRFRQMAYLIKHWAKQRKINNPYQGTLSSYCYSLMVINYLQTRSPPILPCLQSLGRGSVEDKKIMLQNFDTYYYEDVSRLVGFGAPNKESLTALLLGFFRLYGHEFDFRNTVVSVRTGQYLNKKEKTWKASAKKDRHWLSVEDPFEVSHDLGRVCDWEALYEIRGEFMRAYDCIVKQKSTLPIFERYTKEWRTDREKKRSQQKS
jgi:DNA polymerase sigma